MGDEVTARGEEASTRQGEGPQKTPTLPTPDLGRPASGTVRKWISVVAATELVALRDSPVSGRPQLCSVPVGTWNPSLRYRGRKPEALRPTSQPRGYCESLTSSELSAGAATCPLRRPPSSRTPDLTPLPSPLNTRETRPAAVLSQRHTLKRSRYVILVEHSHAGSPSNDPN